MAAIYSKSLQARLNTIAYKYQARLMDRASNEIAKFTATGRLQDSLKAKVIPATDQRTPEIQMTYEDHGDYLTKRRLLHATVPPSDEFVEWMQGRNITPRNIPGYKGDAPNLTLTQKRERAAFAIGVDKYKNDTHKRKQWKKKALPEVLREINEEIIAAYTQEVEQEIVKALTTS